MKETLILFAVVLAVVGKVYPAAAEPKAAACPELSGKFLCPAVARYRQKALTITVKDDLAARTFHFSYDDGSPAVTVVADGKRRRARGRKTWNSYACYDKALIQMVFRDAWTKETSGGSKQALNKDGDYEVTGADGRVALVCRRAKGL